LAHTKVQKATPKFKHTEDKNIS